MEVLVALVVLLGVGSGLLWRTRAERAREQAEERRQAETRRKEVGYSPVADVLNTLGYVSRDWLSRDELEVLIEGGDHVGWNFGRSRRMLLVLHLTTPQRSTARSSLLPPTQLPCRWVQRPVSPESDPHRAPAHGVRVGEP